MTHPLIHEDLPSSIIVRPEIVALTEDLVLLKETYEDLAMQVLAITICSIWRSGPHVVRKVSLLSLKCIPWLYHGQDYTVVTDL